MSTLIRPISPTRRNLSDARSTGSAPPLRQGDIRALRGTLKEGDDRPARPRTGPPRHFGRPGGAS
jgi:hypothetical protein